MSVHVVDRKSKPYVARWRDASGHHRSRSFASRERAEAFDASVNNGATVIVAFTPDEARLLIERAINSEEIAILADARRKLREAMQ